LFGAGEIEIGRRFDCGPGCMIFSSRTVYGSDLAPGAHGGGYVFARVLVGEGVTLYAGCIVGPGVTIGDGAAIGAGSVVLDNVPPRTLYAGVPAVLIREIDSDMHR
jgi:acetyltransferase-like isoleucine patch superfamily enzyme